MLLISAPNDIADMRSPQRRAPGYEGARLLTIEGVGVSIDTLQCSMHGNFTYELTAYDPCNFELMCICQDKQLLSDREVTRRTLCLPDRGRSIWNNLGSAAGHYDQIRERGTLMLDGLT